MPGAGGERPSGDARPDREINYNKFNGNESANAQAQWELWGSSIRLDMRISEAIDLPPRFFPLAARAPGSSFQVFSLFEDNKWPACTREIFGDTGGSSHVVWRLKGPGLRFFFFFSFLRAMLWLVGDNKILIFRLFIGRMAGSIAGRSTLWVRMRFELVRAINLGLHTVLYYFVNECIKHPESQSCM